MFPLLCHAAHLGDSTCKEENGRRNGSADAVKSLLAFPDETVGQKIGKKFTELKDFVSDPTNLPLTASLVVAGTVLVLSILCVLVARRRHKSFIQQQGFRYSQV